MEQAYELQDWLLVFEIAMVTHLHVDQAVDETAMLQRQEMQLEKLKKLKHESGSLEKWLMKFEDQLEVCDALGCKVTDHTKRLYLMENLNTKIFEQTLLLWKSTLTRSSFPTTFAELKAHISNEYSNQMTDPERAKVILNVIGQGTKKPKEQELSLNANDKDTKGKCFLCGRKNHKMKQCWYYDANKTLEQNKQIAEEKNQRKDGGEKKEK